MGVRATLRICRVTAAERAVFNQGLIGFTLGLADLWDKSSSSFHRFHFGGSADWKIVERSVGHHRSAGPLPSAALLQTFAPVAQLPERDASNVGDVGENPSGSANLRRVSPTTRDAPLRTERVLARGHQGGNPPRGTNRVALRK